MSTIHGIVVIVYLVGIALSMAALLDDTTVKAIYFVTLFALFWIITWPLAIMGYVIWQIIKWNQRKEKSL